jgi:hypothetical protein
MNFLFSTASKPILDPTRPLVEWVAGALSPRGEGKAAGREADYSPPSSAKVKKGGAVPPLPHMTSWHNT